MSVDGGVDRADCIAEVTRLVRKIFRWKDLEPVLEGSTRIVFSLPRFSSEHASPFRRLTDEVGKHIAPAPDVSFPTNTAVPQIVVKLAMDARVVSTTSAAAHIAFVLSQTILCVSSVACAYAGSYITAL